MSAMVLLLAGDSTLRIRFNDIHWFDHLDENSVPSRYMSPVTRTK